jgi:hypothetical protein
VGALRFNYLLSILSTAVMAGSLALIHPLLSSVALYDAYLLVRYSFILNSTVYYMSLRDTKRHVTIGTLNFLGYFAEFSWDKRERIPLKNIRYVGKYENEFLNLEITGIPPSLSRLMYLKEKRAVKAEQKIKAQVN